MKKLFFIMLVLFNTSPSFAELTLPGILADNMVLQAGKQNRIWGSAAPGQKISLSFLHENYTVNADSKGEWKIILKIAKAGEGGNMEIVAGTEKKILTNILIGEVWLCSGQSNMEFPMQEFKDFYKEIIRLSKEDDIRFITIKNQFNNKENKEVSIKNSWASIDSSSVLNCSAVAYFFAKRLREKLKVPIGLVISSWSGTPAQSWMDTAALKAFPNYLQVYNNVIKPIDFSQLDAIKKKSNEKFLQQSIASSDTFRKITAIEYNDTGWENTTLPKSWELLGHPELDGIAAYRINFTIPETKENTVASLHLPAIDDIDSTFINGVFIGSKTVWNELRTYPIPAGILKAGKNVITIWVKDDGGGGGLNNDPDNYFLEYAGQHISLSGPAVFKILVPTETAAAGINFAAMQNQPGVLFNGMIAPLLPCTFSGVIWYQGESNAEQYKEYRSLFPSLINNWRKRFEDKNLPFLFVQLSAYNPGGQEPAESDWAGLREAQELALQLPQTGMAVTIDVGDENNIHPTRKQEVGDRLAANAFKMIYGFIHETATGPSLKSYLIEGNKIKLTFKNTGAGLIQKAATLQGFAIAGADKHFIKATAVISGNHVLVTNPLLSAPRYIRYAWANAPLEANLYNKDGFPAAPFRTDKD